jgi:spore coat protein U-like protein
MSHGDKFVTGSKSSVAALSARFESVSFSAKGSGREQDIIKAALGAKTDGERSPVCLDDCHFPSARPLSFGQFQGCQDAADAQDSSQSTSRHSSQKYQAFLDAGTKMDAVRAMGEYLRMAWRIPSSIDESAPGKV